MARADAAGGGEADKFRDGIKKYRHGKGNHLERQGRRAAAPCHDHGTSQEGGAGNSLETSMLELENLVPLAKAYNVNYNRETGYFEYAGLTDLTANDVRNMIAETSMYTCGTDIDWKYAYCQSRVNLLPIGPNRKNCFMLVSFKVSAKRAFSYGQFEVVQLCVPYNDFLFGIGISDASEMFYYAKKLRKITGSISLKGCINSNMFRMCNCLEEVTILSLDKSISFNDSPLLSYDSLKFLVDNAANTSAITVTVHADVYAKLAGTSADYGDNTKEEWMAVMASATERQISFATV